MFRRSPSNENGMFLIMNIIFKEFLLSSSSLQLYIRAFSIICS